MEDYRHSAAPGGSSGGHSQLQDTEHLGPGECQVISWRQDHGVK